MVRTEPLFFDVPVTVFPDGSVSIFRRLTSISVDPYPDGVPREELRDLVGDDMRGLILSGLKRAVASDDDDEEKAETDPDCEKG